MQNWRQAIGTPTAYRVGNSTIRMQTNFVYTVAAGGVVLLILVYLLLPYGHQGLRLTNESEDNDMVLGHEYHKSPSVKYNVTYPLSPIRKSKSELLFRIAVIADLDTDSKSKSEKNTWLSYMKMGHLFYNPVKELARIEWDSNLVTLKSSLALGGRGMELSELIAFNGKLYTVDDRTGVVYEVENGQVIPWVILSDGDGRHTKGFKSEWASVKGEYLYVGGLGKEWTSATGEVLNLNPQWVKTISPSGEIEHHDWHQHYNAMRSAAGIKAPGYMIHEAAVWSNIHHSWFFMPRRASKERYDEKIDEERGTNLLIRCNKDFSDIIVKSIGTRTPSRGFSSFKFIPYTDDQVIIALKSEEINGKIASYVTIFKITGDVLMPEVMIGEHKYEGIEFV